MATSLMLEGAPYAFGPFPIKLHLRYEMTAGKECLCSGEGTTVSISSRAVVFESLAILPTQRSVRLSIDWPVSGMTLDVQGRTEQLGQHTAVQIMRHGFRH